MSLSPSPSTGAIPVHKPLTRWLGVSILDLEYHLQAPTLPRAIGDGHLATLHFEGVCYELSGLSLGKA
ncbi:hypothetical protein GQ53DRAFT_753936 [Thozetella sp. PMI_491]|nr:hypothetical protein GQ53DRAFT_753936 [Thozetella sp. PMI_491]